MYREHSNVEICIISISLRLDKIRIVISHLQLETVYFKNGENSREKGIALNFNKLSIYLEKNTSHKQDRHYFD